MKEILTVQRKREVLSLITGVAYSNISNWYDASRRDLKMDLIVPKERAGHVLCPCILWICGGSFMVVDRSVWMPEMMPYARAGYAVASVEYRTTNETEFPTQLIDIKTAIRYLKAHAKEYAIDPTQIFLMGESAGGALACLAGVTSGSRIFDEGDWIEQDSSVRGVVDFYGPAIFTGNAVNAGEGVPPWTVEAFLGTNYTQEQAARASAIGYVSSDTPPFMILHGSSDSVVPLTQSETLHTLLQDSGVDVEFLVLEGAGHGDPRFYQDEISRRILDFLDRIRNK